nr:UDP-4-amino-4,6-dideoxy-N-acetyl-beta-L-altrosamine N-acetyltransferase [Alkalibacillus aidingensis]
MIDLTEKHLDRVLTWRNSKHVRQAMYTDHFITPEEHRQWFERVKQDDHKLVWLFTYRDEPIGLVNLTSLDRQHRRCYWGFYMGELKAPRGAGTAMGILAIDKIFQEQKLHKICAEVIEMNQKSLNYHQKLGFHIEGRLKDHIIKNHQYHDVLTLALFADYWQEVKTELRQ